MLSPSDHPMKEKNYHLFLREGLMMIKEKREKKQLFYRECRSDPTHSFSPSPAPTTPHEI